MARREADQGPPTDTAETWARIAERGQRVMRHFLAQPPAGVSPGDAAPLIEPFTTMTSRLLADPRQLAEAQMALWQGQMALWQGAAARMLGQESAGEAVAPAPGDRRFRHPAWQESVVFDTIKQSYLLSARTLRELVAGVEDIDEETARKVDFYTRQFVDAMAPTNFAVTNPEVIEETIASNGDGALAPLCPAPGTYVMQRER